MLKDKNYQNMNQNQSMELHVPIKTTAAYEGQDETNAHAQLADTTVLSVFFLISSLQNVKVCLAAFSFLNV